MRRYPLIRALDVPIRVGVAGEFLCFLHKACMSVLLRLRKPILAGHGRSWGCTNAARVTRAVKTIAATVTIPVVTIAATVTTPVSASAGTNVAFVATGRRCPAGGLQGLPPGEVPAACLAWAEHLGGRQQGGQVHDGDVVGPGVAGQLPQ